MRKKRIIKLILTLVSILLAVSALPFGVLAGIEGERNVTHEEDVYQTYGFAPALPIDGVVCVTSLDYYYEEKNDALPGLHGGIDIVAATGTAVKAVADGTVVHTGYVWDYGNNVIVEHSLADGKKLYSRYAHLSKISVSIGDKVAQGDKLGASGNTGNSYSAHLHLEIYESELPDKQERSYSIKYYLGQGADTLSRMKFYIQPISGEYNSQLRVSRLGSGGSCASRCALAYEHDHISRYANYIKAFYTIENKRYVYNEYAEAALFSDSVLQKHIYQNYDKDADGHLSFSEVMGVFTLDLLGLELSSLDGCELFENLTAILTDGELLPITMLTVNYSVPAELLQFESKLGTWQHTDTSSYLRMRDRPTTSGTSIVAKIDPLAVFRVTETAEADGYLWGKTVYNGTEGWCALSDEWALQLSCTEKDFYIDSENMVRCIDTAELMSVCIDSRQNCSDILGAEFFDFLPEGRFFVGWALREGGDAVDLDDESHILTLCPELSLGDEQITLYAVIGKENLAGDANGDGVLTEADVDALVRYLSGYNDENTRADLFDINCDGKVNTRDVIAVKQIIAERYVQ